MENLKTYLCKNCKHEGTPQNEEPCYTCTYYNLEAMSPVEFVYSELENIFDNYSGYDRRLKAYELLNLALPKSDGNLVADTESKCNKHIINSSVFVKKPIPDKMLTTRDFVLRFKKENGKPPSYGKIAKHFGICRTTAYHRMKYFRELMNKTDR